MTLLAVAASTPRVLADFWLYSVQQNDIVDSSGGGFQTGFLQAFPGPPSCEDVEDYDSLPAQGLNDASSSGMFRVGTPGPGRWVDVDRNMC